MSEALLKSATFIEEHRTFKEGDTFDFKPGVNLIVGDQGAGKSTLLDLVAGKASKTATKAFAAALRKDSPVEVTARKGDPVPVNSFDMEHDNPRTQSYFRDDVNIFTQLNVRFISHGETIMGILRTMENEEKIKEPTVWLLDECDSGLSIRSCYKIAQLFKKVAKKGHQIVAVVYSQTIMEEFDEVLSIEHKKWMLSKDFIKSQKEIVNGTPKKD